MFKNYIRPLALALCAATLAVSAKTVGLPTVNIQGKEYYCYRVESNESSYGICNKFGWDFEKFTKVNTGMGKKASKGQLVYYPVDDSAHAAVEPKRKSVKVASPAPITHTVKRGETIYSLAKLYGVPVDRIYANNPSARQGVRRGEVLTIAQGDYDVNSDEPFFYTVRPGDTLSALAQKYNTGVEQLMEDNPGISERNFRAGENIRITPNSRPTHMEKSVKNIDTVTGFSQYKVKKNDTWESIASANGVSEEQLKSTNASEKLPEKGQWVTVPKVEKMMRETYEEVPDVKDATVSQRDSIYQRVHNISATPVVNATVVMESPKNKSSIDFVRGFIMGVDAQKRGGYKINLNVINGAEGLNTAYNDSVLNASNLIVGVYDDNFPARLGEIGRKNGIEVINVLDTKSELFETNPSMVQILQPIDYFNELSISQLMERNPGFNLLMVGEVDDADKFADALMNAFPSDKLARISLEEFKEFPFSAGEGYFVYSSAIKKADVKQTLDDIIAAQELAIEIVPIGRAQWVAYAKSLAEEYGKAGVIVPSRFYNDPSSEKVKAFDTRFNTMFHRTPVNSYPQYAMLGYDVANYFLPTTARNGGDYNAGVTYGTGLQNDIDLRRLNNWSGFLNVNGYLLKYLPEGIVEKIEIK